MKKFSLIALTGSILTGTAFADLTSGQVSGGLLAGWDFSGVSNVSNAVNAYTNDVSGISGYGGTINTNGSLGSDSLTQMPSTSANVRFASLGRAVSINSFRGQKGFDQSTTVTPGSTASGQVALKLNSGSAFSFTIALNQAATNVAVEFDWLMDGAANFGDAQFDWLDIEYSAGGTAESNFVAYEPNDSATVGDDFYASRSTEDSWSTSSGQDAFHTLIDQSNSVIDLSALGNVKYIRFNVDASDLESSLYLDNISVTGAVPEPSTYAIIAGVVALGLAIVRRKK
ncbi:MAG: PEP-CTERM sorting domain-containing protein [Opitutales bacterium]